MSGTLTSDLRERNCLRGRVGACWLMSPEQSSDQDGLKKETVYVQPPSWSSPKRCVVSVLLAELIRCFWRGSNRCPWNVCSFPHALLVCTYSLLTTQYGGCDISDGSVQWTHGQTPALQTHQIELCWHVLNDPDKTGLCWMEKRIANLCCPNAGSSYLRLMLLYPFRFYRTHEKFWFMHV